MGFTYCEWVGEWVNESDNAARLDQLKNLERQGQMLSHYTTIWAKAIQSLP